MMGAVFHIRMAKAEIALLNPEGSGIAKRIRHLDKKGSSKAETWRFGTTPAVRATLPDSGGVLSRKDAGSHEGPLSCL